MFINESNIQIMLPVWPVSTLNRFKYMLLDRFGPWLIRTPFLKKNIGQFVPQFSGVRIDQWSRSELAKVRISQGPNCPQPRSESGRN